MGPPIVLIVAGSIVFIIAFLGCFGAIRESYNMLLAVSFLQSQCKKANVLRILVCWSAIDNIHN